MNKYFEFNKPFQKLLPFFMIMIGLTVLLGTSYSYIKPSVDNENSYTVQIGNLQAIYDGKSNVFKLENTLPMSDIKGIEQTKEYVFTVKNTSNIRTRYNIYLKEIVKDTEFASVIKYITKKGRGNYTDLKILSQDNYLDKNAILDANESVTYHVKLWLDEAANNSYYNKDFSALVTIETNTL